MASLIYGSLLYDVARGEVDFAADSFKVMLVGPGYVPDKAKDRRRSDVASEISGRGYVEGGVPVAVTVSKGDDGSTEIRLGGAVWAPATLSAKGAVYYKSRGGSPADDELVAYIEQENVIRSSNGNWTLNTSLIRLADQ